MKLKSFIVGVLAVFLALLPSPTFAMSLIDEALLYFNGMNGIYFYRGHKKDECVVTNGGNQNYAGVPVWSEAELAAISENQAIYEEAALQYGFPWQVMAVLHYMETGLRRYNPGNGQGVYQLYSYTNGGSNENSFAPSSNISEAEFRQQTMTAAEYISSSAGDLNNPDNVKKLFFKYNGVASQYIEKALALGFSREEAENGEGSPYVMNGYDAKRDPSSSEMDPAWAGRFVKDGVYDASSTSTRFGAFVKYASLYGSVYCRETTMWGGDGNIVNTALALSWDGHGYGKNSPKPEYVEAMKAVGTYFTPCRGNGDCAPVGASCDVFVSTVMRYSGSDPSFPATGPIVQENYMRSHPEMYSHVAVTDTSQLLPGDILVATDNGRHIYINLGGGKQASASYNDRTGENFSGVYLADSGGTRHYNVYRRIQ
ncbi:hypothetical protein IKG07_01865 [Candidatus Saccharibacteria bacterium]|nr:hypothetical protein [Candidatus Saccharibacteria bacterium]